MKRLLIAMLVLLSIPAMADHHRGHTTQHIDDALVHLDVIESAQAKVVEECNQADYSDYEIEVWTTLTLYAATRRVNLEYIKWQLSMPEPDLFDLRRRMDTPRRQPPFAIVDASGNSTITSAEIAISRAETDDPCAWRYQNLAKREARVWQSVNLATWHIVDSIHEEIYLDPVAICTGEGNHCE